MGRPVSSSWSVASTENRGRTALVPGTGPSCSDGGPGFWYWAEVRMGSPPTPIRRATKVPRRLAQEDELARVTDAWSLQLDEVDPVREEPTSAVPSVPGERAEAACCGRVAENVADEPSREGEDPEMHG